MDLSKPKDEISSIRLAIFQISENEEILKQELEIRERRIIQEQQALSNDINMVKSTTSRALKYKMKHEKELQRIHATLHEFESQREALEKRLKYQQNSKRTILNNKLQKSAIRGHSRPVLSSQYNGNPNEKYLQKRFRPAASRYEQEVVSNHAEAINLRGQWGQIDNILPHDLLF